MLHTSWYVRNIIIFFVHVVYCQPLPNIINGSATCSLGDDGVPSFNDTCDITCNYGYLLRGNPTRTCLSDGSWSGADDACVESMLCVYVCTVMSM